MIKKHYIFMVILILIFGIFGSVGAEELDDLDGISEGELDEINEEEIVNELEERGVDVEEVEETGDGSIVDGLRGMVEEGESEDAEAIAAMFSEIGPGTQAFEEGSRIVSPAARVLNLGIAMIIGATALGLALVTTLDLAFIAFPPIRGILMGNSFNSNTGASPQPMGGGGMMGGRMGGRMGGMGGMGIQQPQSQQEGGVAGFLSRWISDEAIASVREAQAYVGAGMQNNPNMGGGLGMGMGSSPMMGGGMMQQQQQQPGQTQKTRSLIWTYMKKRVFFLILFGVAVVIFTSTIFTDIGVMVGEALVGWLSGISI